MTRLHILVGKAGHFLRWEIPEFGKRFELVDRPSEDAILMSFGPDVLEEAAAAPARARFAVLFPGFSYNPVRDDGLRERQLELLASRFAQVFINPGPLEIAYRSLSNVTLYPFSVDTELVGFRRYRTGIDSLLHASHDNPQKDWRRSEAVMAKTGLPFEVFPPRDHDALARNIRRQQLHNRVRALRGRPPLAILPLGYFSHAETIERYHRHDGFVHVARDVRHPEFIDGKYTASLIEAGVTGSLLFWHDTWGLGNGLESVFELPADTGLAAERIRDIRGSVDVPAWSRRTREEMLDTFTPQRSVSTRAHRMLELAR